VVSGAASLLVLLPRSRSVTRCCSSLRSSCLSWTSGPQRAGSPAGRLLAFELAALFVRLGAQS
jgi:hypothetical protein